jgi:hypothetical protein
MGPAGCGGLKAAACYASWWRAAVESCAQFGLNLIGRFSGIDHFEVKLFRHFVELLDQELTGTS